MRGLRQWFAESLTYKWARRIAVSLIGGTVILIGVAMIVLPGPALVVIPLGLGILGLEFAWARSWLARVKTATDGLVNGLRKANPWRKPPSGAPPPSQPPPVD
jgi:tellurite resistance protein TerC